MSLFRNKLGTRGEELAVRALKKNGYHILERNFRCRSGEIDIIAQDGKTLVFIEVKTRNSTEFGHPVEAVTSKKQYRISKTALHYLSRHDLFDRDARFDVISVLTSGDNKPVIDIIRNAFELAT